MAEDDTTPVMEESEIERQEEEYELMFEELMIGCSKEDLYQVAEELAIDNGLWGGKSRLQVMKVLRADVSNKEDKKLKIELLMKSTRKMKGYFKSLQKQVDDLKVRGSRKQVTFSNKCTECEEKNRYRCNHCFKCGGSDHIARNCSEKGNRLLSQGQR